MGVGRIINGLEEKLERLERENKELNLYFNRLEIEMYVYLGSTLTKEIINTIKEEIGVKNVT